LFDAKERLPKFSMDNLYNVWSLYSVKDHSLPGAKNCERMQQKGNSLQFKYLTRNGVRLLLDKYKMTCR